MVPGAAVPGPAARAPVGEVTTPRERGVRYVINREGTTIHVGPGGRAFAPLPRGTPLRWSGQQSDIVTGRDGQQYVYAQPLKPDGSPSGQAGFVPRGDMGIGNVGAGWMEHGGSRFNVGPAGRALLSRSFRAPSRGGRHRCAEVAQYCMPELPRGIGSAKNYIGRLRGLSGWQEVTSGDPLPDDVAVLGGTSRNPDGHVGFIVYGGSDGITPLIASWMTIKGTPRIDVRELYGGNRLHIFRRVRR